MVSVMEKAQIISMFKANMSQRDIAKAVGRSRTTVSRYVKEYVVTMQKIENAKSEAEVFQLQQDLFMKPQMCVKNRQCRKFSGLLKERFDCLIRNDEERNQIIGPNKQNLTAKNLFRVLKSEGFDVSESTIRRHFNDYKVKHPEVFIRQDYEFGERCEFDFHQVKVMISGKLAIYHQATISFPKSGHMIGFLYKNERSESVMDAIIQSINVANGVPKSIVFDNLTPVVARIMQGSKEYTSMITRLSTYYGFEIITCNPARGNEKGHVENTGKITRRDFFSLQYSFADEKELLDYYNSQIDEFNKKNESAWEIEKKSLQAKPSKDFILARCGKATVNSYSCISIDRNFYSVNEKLVGKVVDFVIIKNEIIVTYNGETVAKHKKVDGTNQYSLDINHYLKTFLKKPHALTHSLALKQASEELKSIYINNYSSNPKAFIKYLLGVDVDNEQTIEEISNKQLDFVSEAFGQA